MHTLKVLAISRHRIKVDGEGVTTLVGLGGCPLNCKYCINKDIIANNKIQEVEIIDLIKQIMLDYCYFVGTDGGVCFGGGEPLLQYNALLEFMEQSKALFRTTIETSLNIQIDIEPIIKLAKQLIIDIKSIDYDIYKRYTGIDNSLLLSNINRIKELDLQSKCIIRVPNIKGFTTNESIELSKKYLQDKGFNNIETFDYVVRA